MAFPRWREKKKVYHIADHEKQVLRWIQQSIEAVDKQLSKLEAALKK